MEERQKNTRCFLIKHEECGSLITVDSSAFLSSFKSKERSYFLRCPNCYKFLIKGENFDTFLEFLRQYETLNTEILENASITEIPSDSEDE